VIQEVREKGIGADELPTVKIKMAVGLFAMLEGGRGGYMPKYGLMHLLACSRSSTENRNS